MEKTPRSVTMRYVDISSFEFAQTIQKISQTPLDNKTACSIRRVTKELNKVRDQISKDYQDKIVELFGKRDDKGVLVRPKDNPTGFDIAEGKEDEFLKAQEAFGKTEVTIPVRPFTSEDLKDIKLSARDLEVLNNFFDDSPGLHAV